MFFGKLEGIHAQKRLFCPFCSIGAHSASYAQATILVEAVGFEFGRLEPTLPLRLSGATYFLSKRVNDEYGIGVACRIERIGDDGGE